MSEQETRSDTPQPNPEPAAAMTEGRAAGTSAAPERGGRAAVILSILAIVIGIGVAVTAFFTWREVDRVVAGRQQDVQQAETRAGGLENRLQDTARRIDGIQLEVERSLDRAESRQRQALDELQASQQDVEKSVALLRAQMGRSQDGWLLAEVEYLLRIANQRLQLQRDLDTAQAALTAADDRLRELSDPGFLAVRETLAREITAVKAAPRVDINGLALALASLEERVAGLQVSGSRYTPAAELHGDPRETVAASDWREVPGVMWDAIRRLLVIRTHDGPATPMLPPDQEYFLYQNLRLVLESARLALLQQDDGNFHASLEMARTWLDEHFDQDDPATANLRNELFRLDQKQIRPPLPDISASLRLLRQQLAVRETEAAAEAVPGPGMTDTAVAEPPAPGTEAPAAPAASGDTAP